MLSKLNEKLENVTARRENRQKLANEVIQNAALFPDLIEICFDDSDKNAAKACWILELVSHEKLDWSEIHLDFFCKNIGKLKNESAIRSMAKVCQLLVTSHFKNQEIHLSETHLQKITETCFDWLINNTKVAAKCYSIRALHLLGRHFDWIYTDLQVILEQNYSNNSAAYKAVAREVLKKTKKSSNK